MFAIVVNEKGGEQKRLEFDKPEVTIGRVQGNDIILPKGNVSKRHSRIVLKDGKFIIVDLKSTNGTYVNGRKITSPLVVKGTDKIYIGDFILSIEEMGAGAGVGAPDMEQAVPPSQPSRPKQPTVPPPPPRHAAPTPSPNDYDPAEQSTGGGDDAEAAPAGGLDDLPAPEPARPARASVPPPAAAPAPAQPALRNTAPREAPAPAARPASIAQPASRADLQAQPRPAAIAAAAAAPRANPAMVTQPSPPPAMSARPAPAPAPRPAPAPVAAPARKPPAITIEDDGRRAKITEVMRELSTRLAASLGLESRGPDVTAEEDLWSRAERAASDLLDQISADGSLPAGVDQEALLKDVVSETVGTGPLEELLGDDAVREVTIPRFDRVFVDRAGQLTLAPKWFSSGEAVTRAVERLLARSGRGGELHGATGLVEARIDGGLLLTCALPPLTTHGPVVTIRRPRRNLQRLSDLVGEGLLSQGMADFLDLALRARRNVVVAGGAGSGRSTVLAALARAAAESGERVVVLEEAEELDLGDASGLVMQLVGGRGPQARQALWNALRLRPERLVVGDVRGAEALDMVGALAGGADGCLCAVQAGSSRDALARLEAMARLAPEAPSPGTLHEEIGRAVHVVVHLTRTVDGEPRVGEIAEVTATSNGGEPPTTQAIFSFKPDAAGGRFAGTGHVPAWAEGAPPSMFRT